MVAAFCSPIEFKAELIESLLSKVTFWMVDGIEGIRQVKESFAEFFFFLYCLLLRDST